ncbi:major facilitator superfamily domain-containing protein [Globomyces pollinis-pini]|nr:major facilitator superfamily domain-containing protein [Globomyces pollinis-pini]
MSFNISDKVVESQDVELDLVVEDGDFPEGGYGWVIVLASFMIHVVTIGIPGSFGVFQEIYTNDPHFNGSRSPVDIALIGSCGTGGLGLLAIPAGFFIDKFGYRFLCVFGGSCIILSGFLAASATEYWQLLLSQGVLFGIGCSLAFYPGLTIISHYFSKRKGLAIGIAVSGSGLGGLAVAPLLRYSISHFGVANALRYMGLIGGVIILLCAIALKPRLPKSNRGDFKYKTILYDSKFIRLFLMVTFSMFGYFIPFFFVPSFAVEHGMTSTEGALIIGYMQGASAIGRIFLGFNADILGHINTLTVCPIIGGMAVMLIWPFATSYLWLTVFSIIYGLFTGGLISLLPSAIVEMFGTKNIASITGMVYTGFLFGDIFGPPVAGLLLELTKSTVEGVVTYNYIVTMMVTGGCLLIGATLATSIKLSVGKGRLFVRV